MVWFIVFLGVLIAIVGFGAIYQVLATNRDRRKFMPPGNLIEVNGKSLHYQVVGEGYPTVVVDSGHGGTHLDWQFVQPEVAKFTRIVSYDRAGYGWSDLSLEPRTAQQIVDELRQLLKEAGIEPPYVLVGMSLSGLFSRLFAYQHPEEVAGMVLVDVTHEKIYERIPTELVKLNERFDWLAIHVLPVMARIGLLRFLIKLDALPFASGALNKLPTPMKPLARAIYAKTQFWKTLGQESATFSIGIKQLNQARNTKLFPEIPLIVLSAGKPDLGGTEEMLKIVQELHTDIANESPQGVQIVARESGHLIHLDEPELVIDAIRQVVEKVRCNSAR